MSAKARHRTGSSSLRHTKDFLAAGQYDARPAPQWMKTLQDKYEKLHVKIESYSQRPPSGTRYSPSFGKVNSLNRTDRLSLPTYQSLSTGTNEQRGWTFSQNQPVIKRNRGMTHTQRKSTKVFSDITDEVNTYSHSADEDKTEYKAHTVACADGIENGGSTESDERENMNIVEENKLENNNLSITKTESMESCDILTKSSNQSDVLKALSKTILVNDQGNKPDNDAINNQNIQTYAEGDNDNSQIKEKSNKSKDYHKSTRKHMKLFSRMSMEARHAISETMNAMDDDGTTNKARTESSPKKKAQKSKNNRHDASVQNNKKEDEINTQKFEKYSDVKVVKEENDGLKSNCHGDYSDWENFIKYDESDQSIDVSDNVNTHKDHDTCVLPGLPGKNNVISGTYLNQRTYPSQFIGTGRYAMRMHRERTFEITPVGFDVRYRDTIAIGQPDDDDDGPTGEMRAQAVAKCTEWLKKYSQN